MCIFFYLKMTLKYATKGNLVLKDLSNIVKILDSNFFLFMLKKKRQYKLIIIDIFVVCKNSKIFLFKQYILLH